MLENRKVSFTFFVTPVTGSNCLAFFSCRFFYLRGQQNLEDDFNSTKGKKNLTAFDVGELKKVKETEKNIVCRKIFRVEVGSTVMPKNFLRVEKQGALIKMRDGRKSNWKNEKIELKFCRIFLKLERISQLSGEELLSKKK